MTKANSGFVADSGVQKHSAGDDYPITHYCVGDYPRIENDGYWVIQHPAGTKRWCFTAGYRDEVIANFKEADKATEGLDFNVVSERTAFELALLAVEKGSDFPGHKLGHDGKPV
tara:strand:- start:185 stop:526 length:342 start_codon:yes stop_codon:yes gene_type:complete